MPPLPVKYSPLQHIPDLDGVRAIAILMVIVGHWIPMQYSDFLGFGGVTLFFVLSGFLITGILLQYKAQVAAGSKSKFWYFKTFLVRRSLRIFPIYYLYLLVLYLLGFQFLREGMGYFLAYLGNHYVYSFGNFPVLKSHLWSLAVEEQFYLIWPLFILFIPARKIQWAMLLVVLTALISRLVFYTVPSPLFKPSFAYLLTINCVDAFAIGGLLAWARGAFPDLVKRYAPYAVSVFVAAMALYWVMVTFAGSVAVIGERLVFSIASASLIMLAVTGFGKWTKLILANAFMRLIGKVSYGLYVYHLIMPYLFYLFTQWMIQKGYNLPAFQAGTSYELYFNIVCLTLVTFISWHLIEKPINRLKRFVY